MKFARSLMIFSYGLFTIAAQTLLFREFISTFQGNDIGVGIFFGSWFFWVCIGALLVYKFKALAETLLKNIEFLFLFYLPAFAVQLLLILYARQIAGIEPYALFPINLMVLLSLLVNAPVSCITGMFFPLACLWIQQERRIAVSGVYVIEALGSLLGGLGVTVLLAFGVSSARIFLILSCILLLAVCLVRLIAAGRWKMVLAPACILICLAIGIDNTLMRHFRTAKWARLLPAKTLSGSFQTAQAEYLYGTYRGQWLAVREGSVCETLPDDESAGRIAAIHLSQRPDARNILIIGSGLGLCYKFLELPQIQQLTWTHYDSQYVQQLEQYIPTELKVTDERLRRVAGDVRSMLSKQKQYYDIVILNLPDATSSTLNRYYTLEFYNLIKQSLRTDGILGLRISGGENIMGTELINLGASTKLTLEKVFAAFVIVPGEETWFVASDREDLTDKPAILQEKFSQIQGGKDIFPAEGLYSVYLPARAATALENYSSADLPENLLINRDARPLAHLYSLLLAAKQSGAPLTRFYKQLALGGPLIFQVPLLVFIILRIIYISKTPPGGAASSFESSFLVFSSGLVGIGVVIILMYLYQTRFGSLYLYVGLISSLFMTGLTAGSAITRHLLLHKKLRMESFLFTTILAHTIILAVAANWPLEQWNHFTFILAFLLCGLCAGGYFPLAAGRLADSAIETRAAGSKLEIADHLGAAAGAFLTGLAIVPVLGTKATLLAFALLLASNVPFVITRMYNPDRLQPAGTPILGASITRLVGYVLFGLGVSLVICSNLLTAAGQRLLPSLPQAAAQGLAGQAQLVQASEVLQENGKKINYFKVYDEAEKLSGYIFSSDELAPDILGFGGRMNLAIYVEPNGTLLNFHVIRSDETPAYLEVLNDWRKTLNGRNVFRPEAFAGVEAITGATVSCQAIISGLETSGRRFAGSILRRAPLPAGAQRTVWTGLVPDNRGIYLLSISAVSLLVVLYGGFWSRLAVLLSTFITGGIILNAQYSSEQIVSLLTGHLPAIGLSGAFLLAVGVPLLVAAFGNLYCGYICPFGAAQELVGYLLPTKIKRRLAVENTQGPRFIKYVLLFVFVSVFFISRDRLTLAADPLIEAFSGNIRGLLLLIAVAVLIISLFQVRFWCRYLCPVGAFLSLLGKVALLRRYLPTKRFGKCEFAISPKAMDCLYCDRCRYELETRKKEQVAVAAGTPPKLSARYLLAAVLIIAVLISSISIGTFLEKIPAGYEQPFILRPSGGQARDVDIDRIRQMIKNGRLSEREADFYKELETNNHQEQR